MPKKPGICNKDMTFEECELAIVRQAVQMIEDKAGKKKINTPEIQDIIRIVEEFLQETKRICYGGTAINNLLPIYEQFYNKQVELPDYDFYSPDPLNDAKNLDEWNESIEGILNIIKNNSKSNSMRIICIRG